MLVLSPDRILGDAGGVGQEECDLVAFAADGGAPAWAGRGGGRGFRFYEVG